MPLFFLCPGIDVHGAVGFLLFVRWSFVWLSRQAVKQARGGSLAEFHRGLAVHPVVLNPTGLPRHLFVLLCLGMCVFSSVPHAED